MSSSPDGEVSVSVSLCLLGLVLAAGAGRGSSWGRLIRKLPLWRWASLPQSLVPCSERLHLDPENQVENKLIWSWLLATRSATSKEVQCVQKR